MNTRSSFLRGASALLLSVSCLLGLARHATADDLVMIDLQGNRASLDTLRNDGKLTLLMFRYHGCGPCDTSETELQQWYAAQDKEKVSVFALNIDEADSQERVRQRLDSHSINYPNVFTPDEKQVSASVLEMTGKPLQGVPLWLKFGPDGAYIGSELGAEFDWESLDEMVLALQSGVPGLLPSVEPDVTVTPQPAVKAVSAEDIKAGESVGHIRGAMIREDMIRAENWLVFSLKDNPEHPGLLATHVRFLMLTERIPANNPLGYQFSRSTADIMQKALDAALDADPGHRQALYLQAELYATQGDLKAAQNAIDVARKHYLSVKSWSLSYIESMLLFMQDKPAEAVANLQPVLYATANGQEQSFLFQRIWELVKIVAIKHPEVDPMPLISEGLMVRVARNELIEEIKQRSKGDTPLMVIISSEDPNCTYCVDIGEQIDSFVRSHTDKYNFIYTSMEPWMNISYQQWAHILPKVTGVPLAMVFARSQFMVTNSIPRQGKTTAWYDDTYPLFLSENPGVLKYTARIPRAKVGVASAHWNVLKRGVAAFASVRTEDDQAWGEWTGGQGGTQEEVDRLVLEMCAKNASAKGIDKPCALHKPIEK